ncbi:MAG: cytochrome c biogenesis protein CcdA [Bacteroidales bacterium]|nr:cytochrome c biogenesis protein CcdA [Bacteroidales bacterium]MDD3988931.1 cytochrome c biogenesis protein CcdA [Bacteroidales bacterium]
MRKLITLILFLFSLTGLKAQTTTEWNFQQKDNGDGTIDLIFYADIKDPWYMYSTVFIKNGPLAASLELSDISGYEPVGKLRDGAETSLKMDPAFKMEVKVFYKEAVFIQTIKRLTNEPIKVKGLLTFQTCNGGECIIEEFDVSFDIKKSTTPASSGAAGSDNQAKGGDSGQSEKSEGMLVFLLIAFAAGLGGVFTPCVFPMIPMTVSFFLSGSGSKRAGIIKGLIFGLSVTLIYTAVGVIVGIFQSTDATDTLGTHWLPNLIFALLFITFAISFFGAFEITLPSGLANKADAKADKGGYIASFFIAFAMVVVSFSCTGPFVGSILAAAVSGGVALKPILGMLVFGLAFSLPFVLFSFFPSLMKKMPKSGGWLNVVKVVFAFILLAFSMKYLAAVDTWFGLGIVTRLFVIALWIVIAVMLGFYLLGKIKTSHDSDTDSIGTGRLLFAIASFTFATYMIPGLFGAPLSTLSGLLPPPDGSTLTLGSSSVVSPAVSSADQAVMNSADVTKGLCGEAKYADPSHKAPYGLPSYYEIEQAIECAKKVNKPVLLSFKAVTCSVCKVMEANVWSDPQVLEILKNEIVLASLYVDNRTELPVEEQVTSTIDGKVKNTLGRKLRDYQVSRYGVASQPYYVLVDHNENILVKPVGECSKEEFLNFLNEGIKKFREAK